MFIFKLILINFLLNRLNAQVYDSNTIFVNKQVVPGPDQYTFFWNYTDTEIIFKVVVKHIGWIGFGFSPNGGMINSDVLIAFKQSDGSFNFTERSAFSETEPTIDKNQDYTMLFNSQISGYTTLIFKRKITICRNDSSEIDLNIETGTSFVIVAWGSIINNIPQYHGQNKLAISIPLISTLNKAININMNDVETYDFTVDV